MIMDNPILTAYIVRRIRQLRLEGMSEADIYQQLGAAAESRAHLRQLMKLNPIPVKPGERRKQ
jgi:hypothetical protein